MWRGGVGGRAGGGGGGGLVVYACVYSVFGVLHMGYGVWCVVCGGGGGGGGGVGGGGGRRGSVCLGVLYGYCLPIHLRREGGERLWCSCAATLGLA